MQRFFCLFVVFGSVFSQPLVRIPYGEFAQLGGGFDVAFVRPGAYVDVVGWEGTLERLEEAGVSYAVVVDDLQAFYASRLEATLPMGGYRTYDEIVSAIDSLHEAYPDIVSPKDSLSSGWDGHVVWAVKISDNVAADEDEPEVLYDATIHAREVICPEVLLYFMRWLCENYGSDPVATYLVDEREMWFIPVLNPDGYVRNEIDHPDGGGMWRKNTRDNNGDGAFDECDGVDMNRNFGYMWGTVGSSSDPCEDTYMGPEAFSEPEIQGYRAFVESREFVTNLSYHSYSNMYLFPWGYTTEHCADHDYFMLLTGWMSERNGYVHGNISETIYLCSGTTVDWMYGERGVYSITPEVGGFDDGFWPPVERKLFLCQSQLLANIVTALAAGGAPRVVDMSVSEVAGDGDGNPDVGELLEVSAIVLNYGVREASDVSVTAKAVTEGVVVVDSVSEGIGLLLPKGGSAAAGGIMIALVPPAMPGDEVKLELSARMPDGYAWSDTLSFTVGSPILLSGTSFDSGHYGWSVDGDWTFGTPVERPEPHSAPNVLATDLEPRYSDNSFSVATTPVYFIPDTVFAPKLSFWHWYDIEGSGDAYYDGGQVQIRVLPDTDWSVIEPVGGYPAVIYDFNPYLAGQPAFSGASNGWEKVLFDLSPFAGDSVQFRFVFGTDPYVHLEGWYIDDFWIVGFEPETTAFVVDGGAAPEALRIFAVPNPFNSSCAIFAPGARKVWVFDQCGRVVDVLSLCGGKALWRGSDSRGKPCPSGVYFLKADAPKGGFSKVLLIR